MALEFAGPATPLSAGDIAATAATLGCGPAAVRAVCDIEAAGAGFLVDGRPKILFEAHTFHTLTGGQFDDAWPNISAPRWDRSLYGPGGAHQYDRLGDAIALDREAALKSASWGMFQIMGQNFGACGFSDVEALVAAMVSGEHAQLGAFGGFCRAHGLDRDLRSTPPAFADFARAYNGPGYAQNGYDVKLAAAWRKWRRQDTAPPDSAPRVLPELHYATLQLGSFGDAVRALQVRLAALGEAVAADGDFGPETMAAVVAFQTGHQLNPDGIVGPLTASALAAATPAPTASI